MSSIFMGSSSNRIIKKQTPLFPGQDPFHEKEVKYSLVSSCPPLMIKSSLGVRLAVTHVTSHHDGLAFEGFSS